jgi:aminoglycoside phosphotransferase (APT) family kinase protein
MLSSLLQHLDSARPTVRETWRGWRITPVTGGANALVYRVTRQPDDYAAKFTARDDRDRAGREYAALSALQQAGLRIAPEPIWLDREQYTQPVIVQSWLEGEILDGPPQGDAEWAALLDHYCAIHSVSPERTAVAVPNGYLNASSGAAGKALVLEQASRLPAKAQPGRMRNLLARFDDWSPPTWPAPPRTLVRVDGNWRNFLRRGGSLASVDWENSGWGDPAFELSELAVHPAYEGVAGSRWDQFAADYAQRRNDPTLALRVDAYTTIMLVWWVVRWARYLHEVPLGLDARLAGRPTGWLAGVEQQHHRYLAQAEAHFQARFLKDDEGDSSEFTQPLHPFSDVVI